MQLEDIKRLAQIARVDMSEEEMSDILSTFPSILAYIDQLNEIAPESLEVAYDDANTFRDDMVTTTSGEYTEKIIAQMPDTEKGYLKVKQIL